MSAVNLALMRPPVRAPGAENSRAATNELLTELHAGHWRPGAWVRFLAHASHRSVQQALLHPHALAESTLLHAGFLLAARRRRRRWVVVSWALVTTHLGMLGPRRSLGIPNVLTMIRANLPAIGSRLGRWLGVAALATDLLDGRLARATRTETHFGTYADSLADATFWTYFAARHEPNRFVRGLAVAAWVAPVSVVTVESFRRGRMVEHPRPALLRPAAVMQAVLAARAFAGTRGQDGVVRIAVGLSTGRDADAARDAAWLARESLIVMSTTLVVLITSPHPPPRPAACSTSSTGWVQPDALVGCWPRP